MEKKWSKKKHPENHESPCGRSDPRGLISLILCDTPCFAPRAVVKILISTCGTRMRNWLPLQVWDDSQLLCSGRLCSSWKDAPSQNLRSHQCLQNGKPFPVTCLSMSFRPFKRGDYGYPNKTWWFFPMQSKAENAEGCCSLVHHGPSVSYSRVLLLGRDHNYWVLDTCFIQQVSSIRVWDCQTTDHMGNNVGANLRSCGLIVRSWSSRCSAR